MTWTPPADAVCGIPGCTLPPTGTRPLAEAMLTEAGVLAPGPDVCLVVCAIHGEGL